MASNLPELFFTTSNGDPSSGSFERVGSRGDDVQLILGPKLSFISGIPDHYYTGKSAGTQTLSSEIEALYWEGSYHDDSFAINIDSADTSIRSVFYWGESGNDTVTISGAFQALDGQHKYADQHPTDISNAFAVGEDFDRLIIDANSYEGFYISYLENENGFMGRGQELSTRFEIQGPHGGSYMAVDVEEVVFLDKTFSRYNMVLGSATSSSSFLVGTEEDNYISVTEADDRVQSGTGNDFIFTGDGDDVVDSGSGDDVIVAASGNGDDFYNGGKDFDVATYTSSQKSLKINLKKGVVKGGLNGEDSLKSIEGIVGTYYSDSITGNKASNQLDGHKGNDRLFGDRGADFLIGGAGNDYIHGGAGIDTAQFSKRHNRII